MTSAPDSPAPATGWTPSAAKPEKPLPRLRLLQCVSLMLYAGPLFAGLAGYGWAMVWPFTAIFLLWQIVMRPTQWPRDAMLWAKPAQIAAALARIAILAIVVGLSFGLGRGLGGAVGFLPAIPPIAPLALSLLSIPLARLIWNPAQAEAVDALVERATRDITALAEHPSPDAQHLAAADALAQRMLEPLTLMPEDTPDATIVSHLQAMGHHVDDAHLRTALLAHTAKGPEMPMVLQRALMLHASDGRLMEVLDGDNAARVFIALPDTPAVFETFAQRLTNALQEDADVWWAMPSSETILQKAERLRGTPAEAPLRALAQLNSQLTPPDHKADPHA